MSADAGSDLEDRARFLALAQHKLKTPLAVIAGWSGTLQHWELLEADERTGGLAAIERAAHELRAQIDDILDEGRARLLAGSLEIGSLGLRDFVEDQVAGSTDDGAHPIRCSIDARHRVLADPEALRVVLAHVIGNARAYSPGGGAIELSSQADEHHVRLQVTDQGVGIGTDPEGMFEPFRRGDTAAQMSRGTGLGLHVVRLLAGAMGGTVRATDTGTGTAVELVLPAA